MKWLWPLVHWIRAQFSSPNSLRASSLSTGEHLESVFPCEFCNEVKLTTIVAVWSQANPEKRLYRVCENCREGFAGG
jgi:transcription elongation factor Elf1